MGNQLNCLTKNQEKCQLQFNQTDLTIKSTRQILISQQISAILSKEGQITYKILIKQKALAGSSILELKQFDPILYQIDSQKGVYIGEMQKNNPHGYGKFIGQGRYLEGNFINGYLDSEDAIIIYKNGDYYRGEVRKGKMEGKGEQLVQGEHKSRGFFRNNIMEGKGERLYMADLSVYRGNFQNGYREGKGKIDWSEDLFYEGMFLNDKIQGIGHLHTPKYDYWGPFQGNKKQGKGTIKFKDGRKYEGYFESDQPHGYGELYETNGQIIKGFNKLSAI